MPVKAYIVILRSTVALCVGVATMARRATLRASDEDRERVAERLRHATAEGRLLADELEQRLGATFSARTYGELDAIVSDLPPSSAVSPRRRRSGAQFVRAHPLAGLALLVAIPFAFALIVAVV